MPGSSYAQNYNTMAAPYCMTALFWIGECGAVGSGIRLFKHRGIIHSEILFSDSYAGTSDAEKGGVVLYPIGVTKASDWIRLPLPASPAQATRARSFIADEVGCGYDWRGILFAQLFPWGIQSKDRWFCSEICTAALQKAYPRTLGDLKPYQIDPAELLCILEDRIDRLADETMA